MKKRIWIFVACPELNTALAILAWTVYSNPNMIGGFNRSKHDMTFSLLNNRYSFGQYNWPENTGIEFMTDPKDGKPIKPEKCREFFFLRTTRKLKASSNTFPHQNFGLFRSANRLHHFWPHDIANEFTEAQSRRDKIKFLMAGMFTLSSVSVLWVMDFLKLVPFLQRIDPPHWHLSQ